MKIICFTIAIFFYKNFLFCAPTQQEIKKYFTKIFAETDYKKNKESYPESYLFEKINKLDYKKAKLFIKDKSKIKDLSDNEIYNYLIHRFKTNKTIHNNIFYEIKQRYKNSSINNPNYNNIKHNLAIIYYFENNNLKTFMHLYELAKNNHAKSQYVLSLLYKYSYFIIPHKLPIIILKENNLAKSIKWMRKAKKNNYSFAKKYLAQIKHIKNKTNKDFLKLYNLFKDNNIKNKNNDIKQIIKKSKYKKFILKDYKYNKGVYYYAEKKYTKAFTFFYNLAKNNHPQSQYFLAKVYNKAFRDAKLIFSSKKELENDNLVFLTKKESNKYLKYMNKSANNSYSFAKYKMGLIHEKNRNFVHALIYFIGAKKHPLAELKVAEYYEEGIGVEQDLFQSFFYYKKAAKHQNVEAFNKLFHFYSQGFGTMKDNSKALYWFKKYSLSLEKSFYSQQLLLAKKFNSY